MPDDFQHPHDTPVSSGLRFLSELICWIAGPWAVASVSIWLAIPAFLVLVGLPSVFSTTNDKRQIIVNTPGPARVAIELLLYSVAAIGPWFVWSTFASVVATSIVLASIGAGIPRLVWLLKGAQT